MRIPLLLLLALATPAPGVGQTLVHLPVAPTPEAQGFSSARLARIDSMLDDLVARQQIPGAVVLIARNGQIVKHTAYGYRDVGTRAALRKDDIFRIASQSKAITSLAVMMLWEEGRFGLDDPISRYIPEFAKPSVLTSFNPKDSSYTAEPAGREITIRLLLLHFANSNIASGHEFSLLNGLAGFQDEPGKILKSADFQGDSLLLIKGDLNGLLSQYFLSIIEGRNERSFISFSHKPFQIF